MDKNIILYNFIVMSASIAQNRENRKSQQQPRPFSQQMPPPQQMQRQQQMPPPQQIQRQQQMPPPQQMQRQSQISQQMPPQQQMQRQLQSQQQSQRQQQIPPQQQYSQLQNNTQTRFIETTDIEAALQRTGKIEVKDAIGLLSVRMHRIETSYNSLLPRIDEIELLASSNTGGDIEGTHDERLIMLEERLNSLETNNHRTIEESSLLIKKMDGITVQTKQLETLKNKLTSDMKKINEAVLNNAKLLEKIALLEEEISQLKMSIQIPLDDGTEMLNNNNDSTDADNLTYESQYTTDDTGGEFYINGGQ